jgi:hypothetical protein
VTDNDNLYQPLSIETPDQKTFYKLKVPPSMWGKDYTVTVQAINKLSKMSLLSDSAVFEVKNQEKGEKVAKKKEAAVPTPIKGLSSLQASADQITLTWSESPDAKDYKLYWDRGEVSKMNMLYPLVASTDGQATFVVDYNNSGGILGSEAVQKNGGAFKFRVSYISSTSGKESEISDPLTVTVKKNQPK